MLDETAPTLFGEPMKCVAAPWGHRGWVRMVGDWGVVVNKHNEQFCLRIMVYLHYEAWLHYEPRSTSAAVKEFFSVGSPQPAVDIAQAWLLARAKEILDASKSGKKAKKAKNNA